MKKSEPLYRFSCSGEKGAAQAKLRSSLHLFFSQLCLFFQLNGYFVKLPDIIHIFLDGTV